MLALSRDSTTADEARTQHCDKVIASFWTYALSGERVPEESSGEGVQRLFVSRNGSGSFRTIMGSL